LHLVIGTGQPRNLKFAIVSGRETLPVGAQVYATFTGEYAFQQLDEHTFDAMTDEEYFTFRALAQDARGREARSRQAEAATHARSLVGKVREWLLSRLRGTKAPESHADMRSA